jgi:hypothetical protein
MSVWNSSSLGFSDHNGMRHGSGLLKNLSNRISKQHIVEHKMFGSKRKGIQLGKKFKGSGKGIMKGSISAHMPKSSSISPSIEEFDKMMKHVMGSSSKNGNSKKSMFSRKSFG